MIVDRSGVMVVFDGPIDASSVTTDTFAVDLDEDTAATVTDVDVEKNYVFLKLADQLDSDATPMVEIAVGGKVEDMAGNETFANEFEQFTLQGRHHSAVDGNAQRRIRHGHGQREALASSRKTR